MHSFFWVAANMDVIEAAKEIAKIGFKFLDIWTSKPHFDFKMDKKGAVKFKKQLSGLGLGVASLASYPGLNFLELNKRDEELNNLKRTAELAQILGARSARLCPPPGASVAILRQIRPLLETAARVGEEFGIAFGVENHTGYFSINPELCRILLARW